MLFRSAIVAVKGSRPLVQNDLNDLNARRLSAIELAKTIPWMDVVHPQGAFYLWCDVRKNLRPGVTTLDLSRRLLDEARVAAVPGEAFGVPGFLRLSFAVSREVLAKGMEQMRGFKP